MDIGFPMWGKQQATATHSKGSVVLGHISALRGRKRRRLGGEVRQSLGPERQAEPPVGSLGSSWIMAKHA